MLADADDPVGLGGDARPAGQPVTSGVETFPDQDRLFRRFGRHQIIGAGENLDGAGPARAIATAGLHLDARPFPGVQERVAGRHQGRQFDGKNDDLDHGWVRGVSAGGHGPDRSWIAQAED